MARSTSMARRAAFLPSGAVDFLRRRSVEAGGFLLLGAALFLLVALGTY
ncbi:MAG: hypothetical protein HQ511_05825, partial [Rhodospirillales bacterium]|nr:hypothetical protein [Rhodospirillales bacterium]